MSIQKPLFTQMPNIVLDNLPSFSDPELRVLFAAIRNTIGWHRDNQPMSISWFVAKTGLSRPAVIKARDNLLNRDFLIEEDDRGLRGVKLYSVKWQKPTEDDEPPLVNEVDQSLVNDVNPSLVNEVYPLKEKEKEKEKKDSPLDLYKVEDMGKEPESGIGAGAREVGESEMVDFPEPSDHPAPEHIVSVETAVPVETASSIDVPLKLWCDTCQKRVDHTTQDEMMTCKDCNTVYDPRLAHDHLKSCVRWVWVNINEQLLSNRIKFLRGKNTKAKAKYGGEFWQWRLTPDNDDHPNNGPATDAELMAFGVWLRRKWPNGEDFKRFCPQKAETIHPNLEQFRGEDGYQALVDRARKGLDLIIDQGLKGKERDDRIAHLGAALSRPQHKELRPLIPAIMPASPDWVPSGNTTPPPEMTQEEQQAWVAKTLQEATEKKRAIPLTKATDQES